MNFYSDLYTGTTSTTTPSTITIDDIKRAIDLLPKDPLKEWMIKQGCNPDDGWKLLMPEPELQKHTNFPGYVIPASLIDSPMLINPGMLEYQNFRGEHIK